MPPNIQLRHLLPTDPLIFETAFTAQGWDDKKQDLYESYLEEQAAGTREMIVATVNGQFAGYLGILWSASYVPFREENIPEIVDFNVLMKFWRQGIGTVLMDEAERRIKKVSPKVGIGVGLTSDYGAAQVLYVRRGYVPDGRGLMNDGVKINYGDQIRAGHMLGIYLIKEL